jgi:hypothetical protein
MRLGLLFLILIATLFGSGFWYQYIDKTCRAPIHYRIGEVDARFGTSQAEITRILANAESFWEAPLSKELFVYDASTESLPVNFIFDERQEEADKEAELRADLDAKEGMSETVAGQYQTLITQFRVLRKEYETRVVSYESALQKYNNEVTEWNNKGGAPAEIAEKLRERSESLADEQAKLSALAKQLNGIVESLNRIGARGNELITDYNTIVNEYNAEFSEAHEFAQGDYTGDAINIYQFDSEEELTIVLAHEFGHALSLGHVGGEASVMYHLMDAQTTKQGIQNEDKAEFTKVCTKRSIFENIFLLLTGA